MIFGASGTYLLFRNLLIKNNKPLYILSVCSVALLLFKTYEINKWVRKFNFNTLSFLKLPSFFEELPKEIIDTATQLAQANDKSIMVSLLPSLSLPSSDILSMHMKTYSYEGMSYFTYSFKNLNQFSRFSTFLNKLKEIREKKSFNATDINFFQNFFPTQQIFFILTESQISSIASHQIIANKNGIIILKA